MRKARLTLLAIVLLLNLPGSSMPVQTVAAPLTPQADGVYVEDFSTYAYQDYAADTVWDIWARSLRLARPDAVGQYLPALAADADGNAIVVWQDVRNVNHDIYAERVDAVGNRLWAVDVRVSSDTGMAQRWYPAVGVDGTGNAIVVWNDDRNGNGDIYAQKLDKGGNRLWAADVRVNSDTGTAWQWDLAVAVDSSGNAIVVWQDQRNGNDDIYAQRLDAIGSRLWATDLRVNSDTGSAPQFAPAIAMDGSGNATVVWQDWC